MSEMTVLAYLACFPDLIVVTTFILPSFTLYELAGLSYIMNQLSLM